MPVLITLDGNAALRDGLLAQTGFVAGECEWRCFPDGESYVRLHGDYSGRDVVIHCGLQQPDRIAIPLMFCVDTLRELGARSVGLLAPYLAYMRQDYRFHEGEAISSRLFARFLSAHIDWLMTVDPHLHRYRDLAEIYAIPCITLSAMPLLAQWIQHEVAQPLLIGPDCESAQWVSAVAGLAGLPYTVLTKTRHGDRDVEVSVPDIDQYRECTPVLIDDIISTGHTLLETVGHLRAAKLPPAVCIAVHGLFARDTDKKLQNAGVARVVTTNSVLHASNAVDLRSLIAPALVSLLAQLHA